MQISFQTQNCCFLVEFNTTQAAQEILKHLPLESRLSTWGDEVYFDIGVSVGENVFTVELNVGDVVYCPENKSICVFFGPTPVSNDGKPIPISPVVIIGKTSSGPEELRKIKAGDAIRVMPMQQKKDDPIETIAKSERKLSQSEIDILVQHLLAEKNKKKQ